MITVKNKVTHDDGSETWTEEVDTGYGVVRSRVVSTSTWSEVRNDCFCCTCTDNGTTMDPYCRNHGWVGIRACDIHDMPGEDFNPIAPVSVAKKGIE